MENRFFLNSDISDVKVVCEDLGHVRKDGGIPSNTAGIKTLQFSALIWIILRCYFKNVLHFFIWNVTFFLSLSSIYNTVASCGPVGSMWPRVKRIRLVIRGSQVRIPLWLWCSSIKKKKKKSSFSRWYWRSPLCPRVRDINWDQTLLCCTVNSEAESLEIRCSREFVLGRE